MTRLIRISSVLAVLALSGCASLPVSIPWADADGDDIPNGDDACPVDAEDRDDFDDTDGCPEPDNDLDGVPDALDACPVDPEDADGFEDADGCPESNNDGDGIADPGDRCPDVAETVNGWQDADGCPDRLPDADGDGLADPVDLCPAEPEDKDGFQDEDGCPDPDNDGDTLADAVDQCPLEPEVFNGIKDEDGCPERPIYRCKAMGQEPMEIGRSIFFRSGSARIPPRAGPVIDDVASTLRSIGAQYPLRVAIVGHADSLGSAAGQRSMSRRRAVVVRDALVARGVPPEHLAVTGVGAAQPTGDSRRRQGRDENRRVGFVIVNDPCYPTPSVYRELFDELPPLFD